MNENMQELKDMLSAETIFRRKTRLLAKVSVVLSHPLTESPVAGKKHSIVQGKKLSTVQNPRPGLRHSISEPANEKLFMEAAAASAASTGKGLSNEVLKCG